MIDDVIGKGAAVGILRGLRRGTRGVPVGLTEHGASQAADHRVAQAAAHERLRQAGDCCGGGVVGYAVGRLHGGVHS